VWTAQQRYCTACAAAVLLGFVLLAIYIDPAGLARLNPFGGENCSSYEQQRTFSKLNRSIIRAGARRLAKRAARFPRIVAVSGWAEPRAFFRAAGARSKESRAGATRIGDWDPKVTNGFAAERDVILVDNAGVGGSTGETPSTVAAMTKDCVDFCRALDLKVLTSWGSRSAAR
jgi:hypothetical protein